GLTPFKSAFEECWALFIFKTLRIRHDAALQERSRKARAQAAKPTVIALQRGAWRSRNRSRRGGGRPADLSGICVWKVASPHRSGSQSRPRPRSKGSGMGGQHIKRDEEQGNRDAARPDLSRGDRLEQSSLCPRPRDRT